MAGEKKIETRIIRAPREAMDLAGMRLAAEALAAGALVVFPTETVYGLGANARDAQAVREIYAIKGRPPDNPLIVHLSHPGLIGTVASYIPPYAESLIERFVPGPLTLVLRRGEGLASLVSAGLDTVAVRCPSHPVAQAFLAMTGVPVAAPSANVSGRPSPTRVEHVLQDLDGRVPYVIDAGPSDVGLESTVLDVSGDTPILLRPGAVTALEIEETCGLPVQIADAQSTGPVRSPGVKYRHYAPSATVLVGNGRSLAARTRRTVDLVQAQLEAGARVGVFAPTAAVQAIEKAIRHRPDLVGSLRSVAFGEEDDSARAAARLFDTFRSMDREGVAVIVVQALPEHGLGAAFMNRVRKAAAGQAGAGGG